MMASLLNFLKQEDMSWLAACTTFYATCGHWKAYQVIGVLVCLVLKKSDATICSNYRCISLLTIAYTILSSVLCEKLKPCVNKLNIIISVVSDLANPPQERQIDTHHLFVDFKSAFDTSHRDHLYATMSEFG